MAEHFGSDPTAVRLLTVFVGVFTGIFPIVFLYLLAAIVVPEGDGAGADAYGRPSAAPGQLALVFGALLIVVGIAGFTNLWLRVAWEQIWPLVLIGMGALLLVLAARRR